MVGNGARSCGWLWRLQTAFDVGKGQITSILVYTPQGSLVKKFPRSTLVTSVAWLPDASGLLFVGAEKGTQPFFDGGFEFAFKYGRNTICQARAESCVEASDVNRRRN